MLHLSAGDRARLVGLLAKREDLDTEDERRNTLVAAGLEALVPKLDLEGAPEVVMGRIVDYAARFGQVDGEEALIRLCTWIKTQVGIEQQKVIDEILSGAKHGESSTGQPSTPSEPPAAAWASRRFVLAGIAGGVLVIGVIVIVAVTQCGPKPQVIDAAPAVGRPDAAAQEPMPPPDALPPDAPPDASRPDTPPHTPLTPKVRCFLDVNGVKPVSACRGRTADCHALGPDEKTNPDWALCYERCTCVP